MDIKEDYQVWCIGFFYTKTGLEATSKVRANVNEVLGQESQKPEVKKF